MTVDRELVLELSRISTPSIVNAIELLDLRPGDEGYTDSSIRCLTPTLPPVMGHAATAKVVTRRDQGGDGSSLQLADLWEYVATLPTPRVIVMEDVAEPPGHGSMWGEVHANVMVALDCHAVITNGVVRDLPEMQAVGFRTFAGGLVPSKGVLRLLEVGGPVTVGGLAIRHGDLLHADLHGVVHVPDEAVAVLPDKVREVEANERRTIAYCQAPGFTLKGLLAMRKRVTH